MLKIGDFSRLTCISIRMLRYYDEHDILKPCKIDQENGYRYYDTQQIFIAQQLNILRQLDFSTIQMKEVICKFHQQEEVEQLLKQQLHNLLKNQEALSNKILFLQHAIQLMNKEAMNMKYEVKVKTIKGRHMMCLEDVIPAYDHEVELWQRMNDSKAAFSVKIPNNAQTRAYFMDEGYKEKDPHVEICIEVLTTFIGKDDIYYRFIPDTKVASITFHGAYNLCFEVSCVLATWISEHGYELAGPDFCIYHIGKSSDKDPNNYVTEVCFPIRC